MLPDSVLERDRGHDAILLGAVGDPSVPSGVLERGLLLRLRFELDHYVNLRPVRLYPGWPRRWPTSGPSRSTCWSCREGTEGPYTGAGGVLRKGTPDEVATQESLNTAFGVGRVVRYAFERAAERPRAAADPGAQDQRARLRRGPVAADGATRWPRSSPTIAVDYCHVDAASMFFVTQPERFDVIVTDNLFGDILTDLGAAVAGGIGLAASANINPERTAPSMFEPVHGSAPDIAGKQKADPTAAILSAAMLCEHLGLSAEAARIEQAVAEDLVERQGAWAARVTPEIGDDIAERVAGLGAVERPGDVARPGTARPGRARGRTSDDGKPAAPRSPLRRPRQHRSRFPRRNVTRILASPGFGQVFTDHMVTAALDGGAGLARRPGASRTARSRWSPATAVFHYAQEIFEGLKAYRQGGGPIVAFRPQANAARFNRSAHPAGHAGAARGGVPARPSSCWSARTATGSRRPRGTASTCARS